MSTTTKTAEHCSPTEKETTPVNKPSEQSGKQANTACDEPVKKAVQGEQVDKQVAVKETPAKC